MEVDSDDYERPRPLIEFLPVQVIEVVLTLRTEQREILTPRNSRITTELLPRELLLVPRSI